MTLESTTGSAGDHPGTMPAQFASWVARYRDKPALSRKEDGVFTAITYAETDRRASALACSLARDLGVAPGELVALVCNNRLEWMLCSLAIHFLGAVDVPRGSDTPPEILTAILGHAQPAVAILENEAQLDKARASLPGLRAVVLVDAPAGEPADAGGCAVWTLADLVARGEAAGEEGRAEVERRRAAVRPEHLATVIYTSGTTGTPKGVTLTHRNYQLNIREIPKLLRIELKPVLCILQPWHAYERQAQLMCLSRGGCLHYGSVLTLRSDLKAVRPTLLASVPELWVTLYKGVYQKIDAEPPFKRRLARFLVACSLDSARARRELSGREPQVRRPAAPARAGRAAWACARVAALAPFHALAGRLVFRELRAGLGGELQYPVVGGGPLPDAVDEFFDAAGLPLLEGYGMTETIVVMAVRDGDHRVLKSTGHMISGMEYRLVGEDGADPVPGEPARLFVRGPNVMQGYYKDPERTAEVLSEDGWLDTGDLARVYADGSLRVLGRLDDTLVLTSGKNVNAPYLENELRASEWIERAVVIGAGRPYVTAFIAPSPAQLEGLGRSLGLPAAEPAELVKDERVVEHYAALVARISADPSRFEPYERVQRVRLWLEEFRIGRELSQTLKLRRQEFSRLYAREIDELYAD